MRGTLCREDNSDHQAAPVARSISESARAPISGDDQHGLAAHMEYNGARKRWESDGSFTRWTTPGPSLLLPSRSNPMRRPGESATAK